MSVIIRLQGLPLSASAAQIRDFFCGLRIPDGAVNIVGGDDGDAFIGFATDEDARQAMRKNEGRIHNAQVRLFLSSRTEMKEVIDNARSAALSSEKPPSIPPRFGGPIPPPRFERGEPTRFPTREDQSRFNNDTPQYGRHGLSLGRDEPPRYARADSHTYTPHDASTATRPALVDSRFDERKGNEDGIEGYPMGRPPFDIQGSSYGSQKIDLRKSDHDGSRNEPWMNRDRNFLTDMRQNGDRAYVQPFSAIRQEDGDRPNAKQDIFGNGRIDGDERIEVKKREESWRSENNKSFERFPSSSNVSTTSKEEDSISFFGRGIPPKRPLLPPPLHPQSSSISQPSLHPPAVQPPADDLVVELTRLPPDLLRPSILEQFLSPSTPLTLSSVKVVYSGGIHLHSLVRFTSAMDAFNALKKDGEQGVKIRPSTKEAFEMARDGLPTQSSFPSIQPPTNSFTPTSPPAAPRLNLFTMPLLNPNEMMMGNEGIGRDGIEGGRGGRRRREDSPPRGRREERRRRSVSPRLKKSREDRICVHVSNLPFRVKESDIRRMLGPGLNPYAIKKVFNEDNAPSDVWIMEFSSEAEALETVRRRMESGGRQARLKIMDEPEADRLLRQKFKSPPRRGEKEGEKRDSFDDKVRMQQEAIEMERNRRNGSNEFSSGEKALAGAFSAPVFTTNRGFMRGGRGGGRGMRGMRGGIMSGMGRGAVERNCLLVSNMPPLPAPQALLEHLRILPPQFVRVDQIAPDAAIIELRGEMYAIGVAENASEELFPPLNGRRLLVAAMARRQIEEEFNLRGGEINHVRIKEASHPRIDPEMVKLIGGDRLSVIVCDGFPRDLTIDEVKSFFDGFPMIESSVRMRMEGGEGTGECMLAMGDRHSARMAVESLNGRPFKGSSVTLSLLS